MSNPTDIVGHKTFRDGDGRRHEPLTREEADAMIESIERGIKRRAEAMPDEQSAIRQLWDAHYRLKELGWNEAIYCPKDGSIFNVIEPGSTGIHKCQYKGEWPTGGWWIHSDCDLSPSRPILWKPCVDNKAPGKIE